MLEFLEERMAENTYIRPPEYDQLDAQEREKLSRDGMRFFVKASKASPGSVTLQGAWIAKYCQEEEIENPLLLSECLVTDIDKINQLVVMAERVHHYAGTHVRSVNSMTMKGVIRHDFLNARNFLSHSDEDLDFIIYTLGKHIEPGNPNSENAVYHQALNAGKLRRRKKMKETLFTPLRGTMEAGKEILLRRK